MGNRKKESSRRVREGKSTDGMANVRVKGENFYRDSKRVKQLNMYKEGKSQHNAKGEVVVAAAFQSREVPKALIEPNRKWFSNTRVISQEALQAFRAAMTERADDPYSVLLRRNTLPMTLIRDGDGVNGLKQHKAKMTVESTPFSNVFGPKAQRKRVTINSSTLDDFVDEAEKTLDSYEEQLEQDRLLSGNPNDPEDDSVKIAREHVFSKGQSKRIWNELYKVLDSSDVIIHVLDARDPEGTRCKSVEKYLKNEAKHKHLVFLLNKTDLIPTTVAFCQDLIRIFMLQPLLVQWKGSVTLWANQIYTSTAPQRFAGRASMLRFGVCPEDAAWVRRLSKDAPTLAFHASITNSFGKGSLISLLRQFSTLHSKDRKEIAVGMIGYPNVGKSSIINTLRAKKTCVTAPIPGSTKIWQYVSLMKRISMIDCPGIVPPSMTDTPEDILLRGVVRVENVENPEQYLPALLAKCKRHHIERTYELSGWNTHIELLELIARKSGRLLKGGEPDLDGVARIVIQDFLRGRIPWFTPCPKGEDVEDATFKACDGRLGEMSRKRKRDFNETNKEGSVNEESVEDELKSFSEEEEEESVSVSYEDEGASRNDIPSEKIPAADATSDKVEEGPRRKSPRTSSRQSAKK
ncbi:GTPase required for pre-60S ribosomal subunit nuclear export and maturation [Ceratocystis pirilliformis]|uniref:Nucleolar GTP-binding protein 2 n=1 Tax=Ceratocystis pirilliformis TaxID=259994 RepID=A0ABR3YLW5_9PEZI